MLCSNRFPKCRGGATLLMSGFVIGVVIPGIAIVYSTVRIFIVVVRTHRQISALEQSITVKMGNAGFVTVQAMRSAKNAIIICVMSVVLNIPILVFFIIRLMTTSYVPSEMFSFAAMWVFGSNSFVNSLLYLFLYRSVKRKTAQMISTLWANVRGR